MPSAGNWPGACSASKEARRDLNDKSQLIDGEENVEKKVRNVGDVYKVGRSPSDGRQCPGRSQAISHLFFFFFTTSQKLKNSDK